MRGWTRCAIERVDGATRFSAWDVPPGQCERHPVPDLDDGTSGGRRTSPWRIAAQLVVNSGRHESSYPVGSGAYPVRSATVHLEDDDQRSAISTISGAGSRASQARPRRLPECYGGGSRFQANRIVMRRSASNRPTLPYLSSLEFSPTTHSCWPIGRAQPSRARRGRNGGR